MGVLGPVIVGVAMQLLSLVGKGEIVRTLLLSSGFDAWHGLFTANPYYGPVGRSAAVSVCYIVVSLAVAWIVVRRRDFAGLRRGRAQRLGRPGEGARRCRSGRRAAGRRVELGPRRA